MLTTIIQLLFRKRFFAHIRRVYIYMPNTEQGQQYSITWPIISIAVNKLKVIVKDQSGSQLFEFNDSKESKAFLNLLCQA